MSDDHSARARGPAPAATTVAGGPPVAVGPLAGRTGGPVLRPGDDGFDDECSGYQTAFRHRPDVVVGAAAPDDVRAAVEFAAENGLPVGVQATGHGSPAPLEGGVLIATHRMDGVRIDPAARSAWVAAGARWQQVVDAAAAHGLAPLSGSSPHVGAVGYTLGGGIGLLSRRYGYAADHVRRIDIVTADARLRRVTAESDPDLFWALRGGGRGFGAVTGVEIGLVPITRIYGGGLTFAADRMDDVLDAYAAWTAAVPEELTSSLTMVAMPDLPAVPAPMRGRHVATVSVAYIGGACEGERLVAPLRGVGPRLKDTLRDMPFTESGAVHAEPAQPHAYAGDSAMIGGVDGAALRAVRDLAGPEAPVMCVVGLRHLGGALARPPEAANAVPHRPAAFSLGVLSPVDGADPAAVRAAHGRVLAVVAGRTLGRSVNFAFGAGRAADPSGLHPAGDLRRLDALRRRLDPGGVFRHARPGTAARGR
ncbi:FAD-binding oxidoreductase [Nocardiopsis mangrovi]|uniref:FAD-binding oxidoreductase n=1 Tax=Nocardiopsis mangrovi TaxID=1179818 RepID=A0ABV9E8D8_9ACTN